MNGARPQVVDGGPETGRRRLLLLGTGLLLATGRWMLAGAAVDATAAAAVLAATVVVLGAVPAAAAPVVGARLLQGLGGGVEGGSRGRLPVFYGKVVACLQEGGERASGA